MIGFQLIGALHYIHDKNIIHRDVKPDNCVMGYAELNENLYLIDFGLAKKYRSSRTLKQYPLTKKTLHIFHHQFKSTLMRSIYLLPCFSIFDFILAPKCIMKNYLRIKN
jgi:serine/threonine protein kinase